MTEIRDCSPQEGRIFAQNNGKRVTVGGRSAILLHNSWVAVGIGEQHQVGLDFRSDPRLAEGDASPECQDLVRTVFADLDEQRAWNVTDEYVTGMPEIYRDILALFPAFEPARHSGDCLAIQTIYSGLQGRYELGEVRAACEEMADGRAVVMRNRMFVCPTNLGEEIIAKLTGEKATPPVTIPQFPAPPVSK